MKLHNKILISIVLSTFAGLISREFGFADFFIKKTAFIGTLFLNALKMIVIPLIATSIISGIVGIKQSSELKRLGFKTAGYYALTSLLAIITGCILVNIIKPGTRSGFTMESSSLNLSGDLSQISKTLMNIIPTNIFDALSNGNMLSIIMFSLLFGFFIKKTTTNHQESISTFFNAVFETMQKMTDFIIKFTPYGVFSLIAKVVAETGSESFSSLGLFAFTVFLALFIHAFITLPALLKIIDSRISPIKHFKAMQTALLTAFSTASSSATLPLTMECAEKKAGVSNKTTSFVIPLGATINMDGTALYECVATIFIAQIYGIHLGMSAQLTIILTALLVSIGAAGIPMAGLVMMSIILNAVGLPLEGIGLILAVDRVLDMLRTTTNIWSDSCGTAIIAATENEKELKILN